MRQVDQKQKAREGWIRTYEQLGSISKAARKCGIARSTLQRWVRRLPQEGLTDCSRKPHGKVAAVEQRGVIRLIFKNFISRLTWRIFILMIDWKNGSSTTIGSDLIAHCREKRRLTSYQRHLHSPHFLMRWKKNMIRIMDLFWSRIISGPKSWDNWKERENPLNINPFQTNQLPASSPIIPRILCLKKRNK